MIGAAKKIRSEIRFQQNQKKGNLKDLEDPHWLCNNTTLQGLALTINHHQLPSFISPQHVSKHSISASLSTSTISYCIYCWLYQPHNGSMGCYYTWIIAQVCHSCLTHAHLQLVLNLPALLLVLYPTNHLIMSWTSWWSTCTWSRYDEVVSNHV